MPDISRRKLLRLAATASAVPVAAALPTTGVAASGQDIARYAKRFEGLPYVWAGDSPKKGFDCSGLTMFVVRKVVGMEITHSVEQQWTYGSKVKRGAWKAGDLVFFKNTYGRGLTHVGIFLGDGKFIHAENEDTGVVITPIDNSYYVDHYAGARRLV